jgi:hypothetical protein
MTCGGFDPQNIYLWSSLAGIFLGGGFSFIIAPARRRNITFSLVLFSTAVLSVLCAVILAGINLDTLSFILIWFGIASALGFAAFLFWKVLGIPLFFIVIILITSLYYSLYDWTCVSPGEELVRVSMLSESEDDVRIQYENTSGSRSIEVISGRSVSPVVEKIDFPDYFFIVREYSLIKFHGFRGDMWSEDSSSDTGVVLNILLKLPGFSHGIAEAGSFRLYPSVDYSLSLNDDGLPVVLRLLE